MDFRPIEGESADLNKVGPYEVNNELYWIPGNIFLYRIHLSQKQIVKSNLYPIDRRYQISKYT